MSLNFVKNSDRDIPTVSMCKGVYPPSPTFSIGCWDDRSPNNIVFDNFLKQSTVNYNHAYSVIFMTIAH